MDDNNSEDNNTNMNFNEMPQFAIVPNQNGNTININHVSNVVWNLLFDQSPIHSPQVAVEQERISILFNVLYEIGFTFCSTLKVKQQIIQQQIKENIVNISSNFI
eukprot:333901_1